LLADVALVENDNFCGFSSPANPAPTIQQASNNTFNSGKSIVFQFQASTGPNCTGTLVTDLHAVLAIARILNASGAPDFKRVQISAEGNSVDFPPVFKSVGGKWKITADSGTWGTGTFAATVQANKFYPQTIFFVM